ncbi:P-loop containing nucleoside triphosphate hydrolase protein [Aspergillus steynii IBT 23096]|uniref:RNA helicase n=1 Tax=Aspergillus steynii IBT 23096 TaxID=1392250 RepID=A0A2I2FV03_9EURO|nr:P-loop containing nucleoside triphosphate hydrolase protein [Aspergillus steynii IBT 23096]PLB44475.1 P-loop containing nucleoside triphosphate hydrolase protein [Aspergillus steynii IBT 23096]
MSSYHSVTLIGPHSRDESGYHPKLAQAVEPRELQRTLVAQIETRKDVVVIAPPGQGVTSGCILGILNAVLVHISNQDKPNAVVLVSTRELAIQCYAFIHSLATDTGLNAQPLIAQSPYPETERPSTDFNVVVGTPGRVLGGVQRGQLPLANIQYFLLDEAHNIANYTGASHHTFRILQSLPRSLPARIVTSTCALTRLMQRMTLRSRDPDKNIHVWALENKDVSIIKVVMNVNETRLDALFRYIGTVPSGKKIVIVAKTFLLADNINAFLSLRLRGRSILKMNQKEGTDSRESTMNAFYTQTADIVITCRLILAGIFIDIDPLVVFFELPRDWSTYIAGRKRPDSCHGEMAMIHNPRDPEDQARLNQIEQDIAKFSKFDKSVLDNRTSPERSSINSMHPPTRKLILRWAVPAVSAKRIMADLAAYQPVQATVSPRAKTSDPPTCTAFVHFQTIPRATRCLDECDGTMICGHLVQMGYAAEKADGRDYLNEGRGREYGRGRGDGRRGHGYGRGGRGDGRRGRGYRGRGR